MVKEFIILSNSREKVKNRTINTNFKPYSKEFIIKLYFILCKPQKTTFKNSTNPHDKIKGTENRKRGANSGLPMSNANGL